MKPSLQYLKGGVVLLVLAFAPRGFLLATHGGSHGPGGEPLLDNPLKASSIQQLIVNVLDAVVLIGTPIAALFLIYAGFLFVTARGDTEKLKTARKALVGTLIGIAILLGAQILSEVIGATVEELRV